MFILFESCSDSINDFDDLDCVGYTDYESDAMEWRDANSRYRRYKWCPDKEI